jgi:Fungal specific transcription factor domain
VQCVRSRRQCDYRDLTDSNFRDQTEFIVRKSLESEAKRSKQALVCSGSRKTAATPVLIEDSVTSDTKLLELLELNAFATQRLDLSRKITFSLDSQTTCFFFKNYVIGNSRSFGYLQSFYDSGMEEHLAVSVNAVALATFSSEARSWVLEQKAIREYGTALQLLNVALRSSDVARTDSTLISVILLDQFEKILSRRDQRPTKACANHINGATSLVQLRGYEQFQSELGLRIFLQISSAVMISCMQQGTAVPADIIALRSYATNFLNADDPIWRISQCFVGLVNLYAALKDGTLFEPGAVITAATQLDEDCVVLLTDLAVQMHYRTICTKNSFASTYSTPPLSSLPYKGFYHIYDNYRISQAWNSVRLGRILLNEIIRTQHIKSRSSSPEAFLSAKNRARSQLATDTITAMSSEICASVPQFAGGLQTSWRSDESQREKHELGEGVNHPSTTYYPLHPVSMKFQIANSSLHAEKQPYSKDATPLEIAGGYSLLFPLFVVGYSPTTPDRLRAWILNRMKYIGDSMDLQLAHDIAGILERKEEINVWDIYATLGSYVYPDRQTG